MRLPVSNVRRARQAENQPKVISARQNSLKTTISRGLTKKNICPSLPPFLERAARLGDYRYPLELRDRSWINDRALDLLSAHDVAFCIYELAGYLSPREVTANFVYIRLHGPGGPYQGRYDDRTLTAWAEAIAAWSRQGREVFCSFDNDGAGYAPRNALQLQDMLRKG